MSTASTALVDIEPAIGPPIRVDAVVQIGGIDNARSGPEEDLADAIARTVADTIASELQHRLEKAPGDFPIPNDWGRARFRIHVSLERLPDARAEQDDRGYVH